MHIVQIWIWHMIVTLLDKFPRMKCHPHIDGCDPIMIKCHGNKWGNCYVLLYVLKFVNKNLFPSYKFEYVYKSIDYCAKWLK
jgi:hypothetical protein